MITNYILNRLLPIKDLETIKEMLISIRGNLEKQAKKWQDNWQVIVLAYYTPAFRTHKKGQFEL